jgi:hypothetical protein
MGVCKESNLLGKLPATDSGLEHITCCDQEDISKLDTSSSLVSTFLPWSAFLESMGGKWPSFLEDERPYGEGEVQ